MKTKITTLQKSRLDGSLSLMKQVGLTMIETLIVLVILGFIVMKAYGKYNVAQKDIKGGNERDAIQILTSQVRKIYAGGDSLTGDITAALILKAGVFNKPYIVNGTAVTNAYGGAVTVVDNGGTFSINTGGYAKDICVDLGLSPGDFVNITINGNVLYPPVLLQDAVAACSATGNSLTFTNQK